MSKPNVGVIIHSLLAGGSEKQATLIAGLLASRYNVRLYVLRETEIALANKQNLENYTITPVFLGNSWPARVTKLIALQLKERDDVTISFLFSDNVINFTIGLLFRCKVVVGIRGRYLLGVKSKLFKAIYTTPIVKRAVYNSESACKEFRKMGFNYKKAIVIPNGIEIRQGTFRDKKTNPSPLVLSVGRLHPDKGYSYALEAVKNVSQKHPLKYMIVGYGALKTELELKIKQFALQKIVTIVDDSFLSELYQKADIFLSASITEGFPNVIMEAMNYELPVVASNAGDSAKLVQHGKTGYVFESRNCVQMGQYLTDLLQSSLQRTQMGKKGKAFLSQHYSCQRLCDNYVHLIEEMLR